MAYYIEAENISLDELMKRIKETDLVPSRAPLLDGIELKMKTLEEHGFTTLAHLRGELKDAKHLEALAKATSLDVQYLTLLRREIEGYFPKPYALKEFDWLPDEEITRLEEKGIRNTAQLFQAASSTHGKNELAESSGVDMTALETLIRLADLSRVQWVSPTVARMLVEAGYDSTAKLATAGAEDISEAFQCVNAGDWLFKGKIGLRDVKRLVQAARYVPDQATL
jgi:hypothetical protein